MKTTIGLSYLALQSL